ncbi:MAG TPA: hypothetical protein VK553_03490, partial [Candidatus Nitrosopolaris rasttigaisensis]|nr:hypothetical protein [Candidatus Nitrosopolaris rasttigaisensis]
PAFDILPAIMLPEEVMLLDFIAELPLAFPVEVAPSMDEAEPALASIMPIDRARATPKTLDTIFVIGYREHTYALIISGLKYETRIHIFRYTRANKRLKFEANSKYKEIQTDVHLKHQ